MFPMYVLKDGTECSMREFAEKKEDQSYSRIGWTSLSDDEKEFVSTVWLGINHAFFGGAPVIFETMAFYDEDWRECRRYTNEEDAKKGHAEMVAELMARRIKPNFNYSRNIEVD